MKVIRYKTTYYSQKEFGIKEDLINLGKTAKRKIKENRGRLADQLQDRAEKLIKERDGSILDRHLSTRVINPTLEKKLVRESIKRGNRILGFSVMDSGSNSVTPTSCNEFFKKIAENNYIPSRNKRKVLNAVKKSKNIIFHPVGSGSEKLAHEIGHTINRESKNPIYKKINQMAEKACVDSEREDYEFENPLKVAYNSGVILLEEVAANRQAKKLLKEHGISPEELKVAKKSLKAGIDSYKNTGKAAVYRSLSNALRGRNNKNKK